MLVFDPDKLKAAAEAERDAKIETAKKAILDAKQSYRQTIDSITRVAKLAEKAPSGAVKEPDDHEAGSRTGRGWLIGAVNQSLTKMGPEFTVADLVEQIQLEHPDVHVHNASVASTLGRMVNERVKILKLGSGRRPTRFCCIGETGEVKDSENNEAA